MPKGFTEHERTVIRQRLLDQGYRQFSAHGLRKTTVEELAAAAGISKGAFYLFYGSKEALMMAVLEEMAEKRFRSEVLAVVDLPGPTPRARLLAILQKALSLFKAIPLLQVFTGSDYDLLLRRLPSESLRQHLEGDRAFLGELIERCRQADLPIEVGPDELATLLYALVPSIVHQDDWNLQGGESPDQGLGMLLELVAAYCLGEVELQAAEFGSPVVRP